MIETIYKLFEYIGISSCMFFMIFASRFNLSYRGCIIFGICELVYFVGGNTIIKHLETKAEDKQ